MKYQPKTLSGTSIHSKTMSRNQSKLKFENSRTEVTYSTHQQETNMNQACKLNKSQLQFIDQQVNKLKLENLNLKESLKHKDELINKLKVELDQFKNSQLIQINQSIDEYQIHQRQLQHQKNIQDMDSLFQKILILNLQIKQLSADNQEKNIVISGLHEEIELLQSQNSIQSKLLQWRDQDTQNNQLLSKENCKLKIEIQNLTQQNSQLISHPLSRAPSPVKQLRANYKTPFDKQTQTVDFKRTSTHNINMKVVDKNMDNDLNNPNRDNIEKTLKYMKFEMCARQENKYIQCETISKFVQETQTENQISSNSFVKLENEQIGLELIEKIASKYQEKLCQHKIHRKDLKEVNFQNITKNEVHHNYFDNEDQLDDEQLEEMSDQLKQIGGEVAGLKEQIKILGDYIKESDQIKDQKEKKIRMRHSMDASSLIENQLQIMHKEFRAQISQIHSMIENQSSFVKKSPKKDGNQYEQEEDKIQLKLQHYNSTNEKDIVIEDPLKRLAELKKIEEELQIKIPTSIPKNLENTEVIKLYSEVETLQQNLEQKITMLKDYKEKKDDLSLRQAQLLNRNIKEIHFKLKHKLNQLEMQLSL